ncbi:MAG TPA: sigma-54 dependent transcriptional regulator [Cytophagales bacterium]
MTEKLTGKVLVVDDDQHVLYTARLVLKNHFTAVQTESFPSQLRQLLRKEKFDVVLLDMNFAPGQTSGEEGLFWLRQIRELLPDARVVMQTAYGDIDLAVQAMKEGAADFLVKPWDKEKLLHAVRTALGRPPKDPPAAAPTPSGILTRSPAMRAVLQTADRVAATDATVLLLGENGTGKDLLANRIHRLSGRAAGPWVKVDLGAIAPTLFESELFGHVKGAFTDAKESKPGRFEAASGGTLFLDEVGNLPLPQQAKLLTALQSGQVVRVGANQPVSVHVRLISATNASLARMVAEGAFRQDLLYRINTVEITLPPLRERPEDIPLLVEHFLTGFTGKYGKRGLSLAPDTLPALQRHPWPGNVRQLEHATERAVILSDNPLLTAKDFLGYPADLLPAAPAAPDSYDLEEMEKQAIREAIRKHRGNLSKAALELGLGRTTLYRKMQKYGLQP